MAIDTYTTLVHTQSPCIQSHKQHASRPMAEFSFTFTATCGLLVIGAFWISSGIQGVHRVKLRQWEHGFRVLTMVKFPKFFGQLPNIIDPDFTPNPLRYHP
jgi:hypothetical protein